MEKELRKLTPEDITMEEEIIAESGKLNFCLRTDFDVDAVFGTHVCTFENEDYLNVYANYDMAARQVCEELEIVLWRGDDTCESLTYRLGNEERQFIKTKMDDYCRKCEGMALDDFCTYLEKEENTLHQITTEELRQMPNREGLVLQGCGGGLQEWVDGINDLLAEAGILLDGTRFETASAFQHDGLTNLLFSFDDSVKLDMGKLAMWRLQTHGQFGGTWLSDYVPNRLGGFIQEQKKQEKPQCPLIGQDGNIFNLMGIAARALRKNGMADQAKEMTQRITGGDCHSYGEALCIIGEYVQITDSASRETQTKKKEKNAYER